MSKPAGRTAALSYAAILAGPGAIQSFSALWLHDQGLSAPQITRMIGAALCLRIAISLVLGRWARRSSGVTRPLVALCAIAAGCGLYLVFGARDPLVWLALITCAGACVPLLDAGALQAVGRGRGFAEARAVGACAYLCGSLMLGLCAAQFGVGGTLPTWAAAGAVLAGCLVLRYRHETIGPVGGPPMPPRLRHGSGLLLALALGSAGLVQASHSLNVLAMLDWSARGYSPTLCSMFWQVGVGCDIVLLWFLSRVQVRPERLLAVGAAASVIRWAGMALHPGPGALVLLQALHALTATGTYVAASLLADTLVPASRRVVAQVAVWAVLSGLAKGVATLLVGQAFAVFGHDMFWLMAGLGGMGLGLALWLVALLDRSISTKGDILISYNMICKSGMERTLPRSSDASVSVCDPNFRSAAGVLHALPVGGG